MSHGTARDLLGLAALKLAVGGVVLASGFRAVSDDDFARAVLAQRWAESPRLDPTGTSWLPLPFWIYGGVMKLAGTSLLTARVTAVVLGVGAVGLLYAAGRVWLGDRRDAILGAALGALLPWSAYLGVATVPELPTAALVVFGVATLTSDRHRVLGALALTAACLCRYEPWPATALFGLVCALDAYQRKRPALLLPAAIAAIGPAGWLAHNATAHGDALHFAARVSAYKRAIGSTGSLWTYASSLLREEPELCIATVAVIAWRIRTGDTRHRRDHRRVAGLMAGMIVALSLASLPGSAPTHHSGRAVLAVWLAMAIFVAPTLRTGWSGAHRSRLLFGASLVVALGVSILRPWFARLDRFTPRHDEVAIGAAASSLNRVLLEIDDYRFYAIEAGSGRPSIFMRERSIDPRYPIAPNVFLTSAARARAEALGARAVVCRAVICRASFGKPVAEHGPWALFILEE